MAENILSVRLEIKNEAIRKELEEIVSVEEGFRLLRRHDDPDPCDLLIFETGKDIGRDFLFIQTLKASGAAREVILTSANLEPDVLLQALRAEVKEFFSQPIKREEIRNGLLKFRQKRESLGQGGAEKKKGRTVTLVGSKGGVGTTTVAVNLATNLSASTGSPSVALIDINLVFGQIPTFLNIESSFNWGEVMRNWSRVDETYLMSTLSRHRSGVYVLPSPPVVENMNGATSEMMERLLGLMRNVFDFILIDGGQRFDDLSFKVLEMSDDVFLVTVLDLPCLTNAKRLLWTFQKLGFPPKENIKIIVNRYKKKSPISLKDAEQAVSERIHWLLPNDYPLTMSAINQGKPVSDAAPSSELGKSLRELAGSFLSKELKKRSWFWE